MNHDTLHNDLKEAMEGLQIITGCGPRNQHYIDRQVDKIKSNYCTYKYG